MNTCPVNPSKVLLPILIVFGLLIVRQPSWAQGKPAPTHADVSYDSHERNVLDFWQAESHRPTPLVIYIHGGGFRGGNKNSLASSKIHQFLDSGISVAALHYRLLAQSFLPAAHHDCRRAVQFLRTKSDIFMQYRMAPDAPQPNDPDQARGWRVHHVNFGVALLDQAKSLGVPAYLKYPGAELNVRSDVDFFRDQLLNHDNRSR